MARDYVPHNTAQFNAFMANLTNYATANMNRWATIPAAALLAVIDSLTAFQAYYLPLVGKTPQQSPA